VEGMAGESDWALQAYENGGPMAIHSQASWRDLLEWVAGADAAMRHAYWKWNDLRGAIMLGHDIMELADSSGEMVVLGAAKPAIANLATWTWPGWDEQHRRPTPEMLALGIRAAGRNLELAGMLGKPPIAFSRALWIVGAHHMLLDLDQASEAFLSAAEKAREAEADVDALMNQCYAWGCQKDPSLGGGLADLESMGEDGVFFAGQIKTALKVFNLPSPG
jgi:hypothetical protein